MTSDSIERQIERIVRADAARRGTGLEETLRRCENAGEAVFLFGGDATTIYRLRSRIHAAFPRLRLAGICDADFAGPAGRAVLDHIAACAPDLVVADVAPQRHRALIAEFAAYGLRTGLTNLPGTFAPCATARPLTGAAAGFARLAARLPMPAGRALGELVATMRFSAIVARQLLQGFAPRHASQAYHAVRRDG